jgi:hypothetical protein
MLHVVWMRHMKKTCQMQGAFNTNTCVSDLNEECANPDIYIHI